MKIKNWKLEIIREWRHTVIIGLVILLIALFLRLYNLTYLPIFVDEAIYVRWAQVMRAESTLRFLPLSDGKQPLFMWSVIPLLKVFSDPLFAGRLLSVLTGMGTMVGIFVLTFYLFRSSSSHKASDGQAKKIALIASFIYSISPFSVFFDRMALVDSMLTMFGVWTLFFVVVTAKTLRLDFAMLAGFALGGALLTKSPALFFVILLPTTALLTKWPKIKGKKLSPFAQGFWGFSKVFSVGGHLIKLASLWVVTTVIGYGLYNILRLGPEFPQIALRNRDYVYPLEHILQRPLDPLLPFLDRILEFFWILGPSVLVIFVALGFLLNIKKYPREVLLLSIWAILPAVVISEFSKTMTARYAYFIAPFLIILGALTFLWKGRWKKLLVIGLIVFIFHALTINRLILTDIENAPLPRSERSGYLEEWTAGTGIEDVAEFLREEKTREPDKGMVVGTEGFFGTLPDGLQIYLNDLTDVVVIGVGVIMTEVHPSLIESRQAGNKTYLVVNSSRLKFEPEAAGLELLAAYPKAFRGKNTHEYTQNGPRDTLYFFEVTEKAITSKSGQL